MSDRPWTPISMRMRNVVESSRLDDNARDIAAALGDELRHRALQAQLIAEEAALRGGKAARGAAAAANQTASDTVVPALGRAGRSASRRAASVPPTMSRAGRAASRTATDTVLPAIVMVGTTAGRRVGPAARNVGPATRKAADQADDALRAFADSPAGRATVVGALAGAIASVVMGGVMVAAKRAGAMAEVPPKEITTKGAKKAAKAARKKAKRQEAESRTRAEAQRSDADAAAQSAERSNGAHAGGAHSGGGHAGAHSGEEAAEHAEDREAESRSSAHVEEAKAQVSGAVASVSRAVEHASPAAFTAAATALHVGFGMALGAGFGLVHSQLPREWREPLPTLGSAVGFATAVWAGSYAGWVPLLGMMPAPHEDQPSRPVTMVASHWLFGAILGAGLIVGLRATEK